jgi:hypothetical protein
VSGEYLPGVHGALLFGIVVNPVSIGHFTSLVATQNGHVTLCGTSFALLYGPETVNVFLHCMQVMIFSKTFGLENGSEYTPVSPAPHSTSRVEERPQKIPYVNARERLIGRGPGVSPSGTAVRINGF